MLALTAGARRAPTAEALYLSWDECRTGGGSADDAFACDRNDAELNLYCAFEPPTSTGPDVIGIEAVVDVQLASTTLPDWWFMGATGCRAGQLLASADFTSQVGCVDPWGGAAGAEIQGYEIGQPHGGPNQVRILATAGVPSAAAVTFSAGQTFYALRIRILTSKTTGLFACAGCFEPACLVLNGITVRRLSGSPGGDFTMVTPGPNGGNRATWRGGAGADCALVPVRSMTWGRIKAIYR